MIAHVGGDAELYALGVLAEDEREVIAAHLKTCAECSRSVARAERVVVGLEGIAWDESPSASRPPAKARVRWLATAAAFAFAVGLGSALVGERAYVSSIVSGDNLAIATLANAHFLHSPFIPVSPGAPTAKVMYPRDGSWLYVIVNAAQSDWHLAGDANGTELDLGPLQTRGTTSMLFVRPPRHVEALRLIDADGVVIERVETLYPARH